MDKLIIHGNKRISGDIEVQGSKNAALSLLMASLVVKAKSYISNVPDIGDVHNTLDVIKSIGCIVDYKNGLCKITCNKFNIESLDIKAASRVRYSILLLGALAGQIDKIRIPMPGGCVIGLRRLDIHLDTLRTMGATIKGTDKWIEVETKNLHSAEIQLRYSSDTGTVNAILAACNVSGKSVIDNASISPETNQVCRFLNHAGMNITGIGTKKLTIWGKATKGMEYSVIPDRLVALTYMIAALITHGNIKITNLHSIYLTNELNALKTIGADIRQIGDDILVESSNKYNPCNISGSIYPEFHTDAVPLFVPLLLKANGNSVAKDLIFDNRFNYIDWLNSMGANITKHDGDWNCPSGNIGQYIVIKPSPNMRGNNLAATDLRGGMAMLLSALAIDGKTVINDADIIYRGYENIVENLNNLGAEIEVIH